MDLGEKMQRTMKQMAIFVAAGAVLTLSVVIIYIVFAHMQRTSYWYVLIFLALIITSNVLASLLYAYLDT